MTDAKNPIEDRLSAMFKAGGRPPVPVDLERMTASTLLNAHRRTHSALAVALSTTAAVATVVAVSAFVLMSHHSAPAGTRAIPPVPASSASPTPTASAAQSPLASAASPSSAPTVAQSSPTPAEAIAIAQQVFGKDSQGFTRVCTGAACPTTARLSARLLSARQALDAEPWVRSQYPWPYPTFTTEMSGTGSIVHVTFPSVGTGPNRLDLIMVSDGRGGLLVDDTQCTGQGPSTSIYVASPPLCYAN